MKALRLVVTQRTAHYRKEETDKNKMTYPLPQFSTVIGAMHSICGYKEYVPMDVSIQGTYEALTMEPYTDYCFLNSIQDDRGILVKLRNGNLLSNAFDKVAKAKNPQGNSFREGITIDVINKEFLDEYRNLKKLKESIDKFKKERLDGLLKLIKARKKALKDKQKLHPKASEEFKTIKARLDEITALEKNINERVKEFEDTNHKLPYSRFATLTTSLKYYETLNNVRLIIHVRAEEKVLGDIYNNIYRLNCLGRSEDFVDIEDASIVELCNEIKGDVNNKNSAYIDFNLVKDEEVFLKDKVGIIANGTKYYISKNYSIVDNKRVFEKKKVVYVSDYTIDTLNDNLLLDNYNGVNYIVNFN